MSIIERIKAFWGGNKGNANKRGIGRRAFKGAEISRLTSDWVASTSATIDEDVRRDAKLMRSRARELARNSPVARNYLTLLAAHVIGPNGFKHQALVRDNARSSTIPGKLNTRINDNLETGFAEWSRTASLDGRLSLNQISHQLITAVARDGEVLVRFWRSKDDYGLRLEAIDADLLDEKLNVPAGKSTNEIRMGVEIDRYGRRVAYHVWDRPQTLLNTPSDRTRERINADEILHLYDPERVNQTRGVTWFASVMLPLHMIEGYVEAELTAARVSAAKMGWFVRKETDAGLPPESEDGSGIITTEAAPGSFDFAPDGYDVQAWDPNHPNGNFGEFIRSALRQVAVGLRVSYNALVSDLESVNYSSMRSGMLIEREVWRQLQQWWIHDFLEPVYREWVLQAVLTKSVSVDTRDFKKLLKYEFTPRGWAWVDPQRDIQATILAIENGLTTKTDALAEQGTSYEDVLAKRAAEIDLEAQYGVTFTTTNTPAVEAEDSTEDAAEDTAESETETDMPNEPANPEDDAVEDQTETETSSATYQYSGV